MSVWMLETHRQCVSVAPACAKGEPASPALSVPDWIRKHSPRMPRRQRQAQQDLLLHQIAQIDSARCRDRVDVLVFVLQLLEFVRLRNQNDLALHAQRKRQPSRQRWQRNSSSPLS